MKSSLRFGFTLIETMVVLAIVTLLSFGIFRSFSTFRERVAIASEVSQVVSLISSARERTLSSEGGLAYGVALASDRIIIFSSIPYDVTKSTNEIYLLEQGMSIPTILLSGGGTNFTFQKITGVPSRTGTFVLRSPGGTATTTVTISAKGTVTIQ